MAIGADGVSVVIGAQRGSDEGESLSEKTAVAAIVSTSGLSPEGSPFAGVGVGLGHRGLLSQRIKTPTSPPATMSISGIVSVSSGPRPAAGERASPDH